MNTRKHNTSKNENFISAIAGTEGKALISGGNALATLRNDNVYPENSIQPLSKISGFPCRKGMEQVIISGGTIVNSCSDSYGHLPNENYFTAVEEKLINAEIGYATRSINRDNRSFAVDYILNDDNMIVKVNQQGGKDTDAIRPMLRFVNSYDGSNKTSGYFGFFRALCQNGLHMTTSKVGFSVKHRGAIAEIVMPEIHDLINKFLDNEYYTLIRKFQVLAEKPITDIAAFTKLTCDQLGIFMYQCSKENLDPSLNARLVESTISREANLLGVNANYWLGYNAFNEVIHDKLKKSFELQKTNDTKLFNYLSEIAAN